MPRPDAPGQHYIENDVLHCLDLKSPQSLASIRKYIGEHCDLLPEERAIRCYPSGKEIRPFEQTVDNLLQSKRSGNLTDRKYVEWLKRDTYAITPAGKLALQKSLANQASLAVILSEIGSDLSD